MFFSCKSSKTITTGDANLTLSVKDVIKENTKAATNFNTLKSRLKISYATSKKSESHTVDLRIEKDKVIWINSAFSVLRAKITPTRVAFYNKWENEYFDGDFAFLSNLLGTDINFEKLQNLLLGETLFALKEKGYTVSVFQESYLIKPKRQNAIFEIMYLINPSHFKLNSQQLLQSKENRYLEINYAVYQDVNNQILPKKIHITAIADNQEKQIGLEFKSVALNESLRFPFKIPTGFKAIEL